MGIIVARVSKRLLLLSSREPKTTAFTRTKAHQVERLGVEIRLGRYHRLFNGNWAKPLEQSPSSDCIKGKLDPSPPTLPGECRRPGTTTHRTIRPRSNTQQILLFGK